MGVPYLPDIIDTFRFADLSEGLPDQKKCVVRAKGGYVMKGQREKAGIAFRWLILVGFHGANSPKPLGTANYQSRSSRN